MSAATLGPAEASQGVRPLGRMVTRRTHGVLFDEANMKVSVFERAGFRFVECVEQITRVDDAMALIVAAMEQRSNSVLVEARQLPEAFFDLRSLFAGEFIQKFQNYRVRIAAVFPSESKHSDTFEAFLTEAKGGRQFRAFANRADAEVWLSSD